MGRPIIRTIILTQALPIFTDISHQWSKRQIFKTQEEEKIRRKITFGIKDKKFCILDNVF